MKNKGSRGSANGFYAVSNRNLEWFNICDINDIGDTRLADQNKLNNIAILCEDDCIVDGLEEEDKNSLYLATPKKSADNPLSFTQVNKTLTNHLDTLTH